MLPLSRNPLIYRQWRIAFRPTKLAGALLVVGCLLLLTLALISLHQTDAMARSINWAQTWRVFATVVLGLQVVLAYYAALAAGMDSVATEKLRKTQEFLVTLPIGPADKAVGLAIGHNLHPLLLILLLTPLAILAGSSGGMDLGQLVWLQALVYAGFAACSLAGVAMSAGMGGGPVGWVVVLLLGGAGLSVMEAAGEERIMPLLTICPFAAVRAAYLTAVGPWGDCAPDVADVFRQGGCHFFSTEVPWQVAPLAFLIFFAALAYLVARRKLSRPSGPPLHRGLVVVAFIVFQVLLVGFLADALGHEADNADDIVATSLSVYFVFVLLWALLSQPDYAALMEWVQARGFRPGQLLGQAFGNRRCPNLVPMAALWVIAAGTMVATNRLYWDTLDDARVLITCGTLLAFLLLYQLVLLLMSVSVRRNGRILGLLLVVACVAIPVAFSTIPEMEGLVRLTPMGLFENFGDHVIREPFGEDYWRRIIIGSVAACLGAAVVAGLCIAQLRALRRMTPQANRPTPDAA